MSLDDGPPIGSATRDGQNRSALWSPTGAFCNHLTLVLAWTLNPATSAQRLLGIWAWAPEDKSLSENWFIDIGAQYQN